MVQASDDSSAIRTVLCDFGETMPLKEVAEVWSEAQAEIFRVFRVPMISVLLW